MREGPRFPQAPDRLTFYAWIALGMRFPLGFGSSAVTQLSSFLRGDKLWGLREDKEVGCQLCPG